MVYGAAAVDTASSLQKRSRRPFSWIPFCSFSSRYEILRFVYSNIWTRWLNNAAEAAIDNRGAAAEQRLAVIGRLDAAVANSKLRVENCAYQIDGF